jgi:FkbM family methyltransferase
MLERARLVHRALRYRWKLNPREVGELVRRVPRGGVAIDLGAHKGGYTYWLRRAVGPRGLVVAVEPQQELARRLTELYRDDPAVRVIHAAGGGADGRASLSLRSAGPTHGASIHGFADGVAPALVVEVDLVSLAGVVERAGLARLDAIKCDTEGAEVEIVEGGRAVIERFRPVALVECERRHGAGDGEHPVERLRRVFEPLGYQSFLVTRAGLVPIDSFDEARHQTYGVGEYANNFLFVPGG